MPMTYTDELILQDGKHWVGPKPEGVSMQEYREGCAKHLEESYQDYMAAWEVRTGRPWTSMNLREAEALGLKHPILMRNIGFLSILRRGG